MAWAKPNFVDLYNDNWVDEGICYGLMYPLQSFNYTYFKTSMYCDGYEYVSPPPLRRVRFFDARPLAILNCRDLQCDPRNGGHQLFDRKSYSKVKKRINSYICHHSEVSFVLDTIRFPSSQKRQEGRDRREIPHGSPLAHFTAHE